MTTPEARYHRWRQTALVAWALIGILILVAAALWGLMRISSALIPFVIAFILVFLLNWPVRAMANRGLSRGAAAGLALVIGFLILGGLVTLMGPFVARQSVSLANATPGYFKALESLVTALQARYATVAFPTWLSGFISTASDRLSSVAVSFGNGVAQVVVSTGSGVVTGLFDFVIAIVIAFWALKDLPKLKEELIALPGPKYRDDAEHLISTVTRVVGGYLRGVTTASFCTGSLTTLGLLILGVPYALVLGIVTFFLNYIPYVGPFIAGVLAGLVGLTKGPWTALFAIGVVILAQNLTDNLVTPRVMSSQVDLHPTLVIFSLLVGGSLFGVPGMIFAIPVAATGKGLFVYYYEQRTQRQLATENGALFRGAGCESDPTTADKDGAETP